MARPNTLPSQTLHKQNFGAGQNLSGMLPSASWYAALHVSRYELVPKISTLVETCPKGSHSTIAHPNLGVLRTLPDSHRMSVQLGSNAEMKVGLH